MFDTATLRALPTARFLGPELFWPASVLRTFAGEPASTSAWSPALDIVETQDAFLIEVELAGLAKQDLQISVEKNVLSLSGERPAPTREGQLHRGERSFGKFSRSFTLPTGVDAEEVKASFENGLLTLSIPKKNEVRSRQIEIQ